MKRRRILSVAIPLAVFALAAALLCLLHTPEGEPVRNYFLSGGNFRFVAAQATVVAVGALGMTLVMAAGGIDLSAGAVIALAGAALAHLLHGGVSPGAAALAAVGIGACAGAINGGLVSLSGIAPFMVTLGTAGAAGGLAQWLAQREAALPRTWIDGLLAPFPQEPLFLISPGIWIALLLSAVLALVLHNTVFGCHLYAVGSNEDAARLCGVRVTLTRVLAYAIAGALFGFAGVLHAGWLHEAPLPAAPVAGLALDLLAAALLGGATLAGGTGSAFGAVIAALGITLLRNGTQQAGWPPYTQEVLSGAILILAVGLSRLRRVSL